MGNDTNHIFTILPLFWFPRKKENQYKPHLLHTALPGPRPSFSRKHCNTTPCSEAKFILVFNYFCQNKEEHKFITSFVSETKKNYRKWCWLKAGWYVEPAAQHNLCSAIMQCSAGNVCVNLPILDCQTKCHANPRRPTHHFAWGIRDPKSEESTERLGQGM